MNDHVGRQAKTFIPSENEALSEVPEAITAGERLPQVSEYSGISLDALPIKGLRSFIYGFSALLMTLMCWEVVTIFNRILDVHWIFAGVFLFFIAFVAGSGARLLWRYMSDRESLEAMDAIQKQANRLSCVDDYGNSKDFINDLMKFYINKPQSVYLQKCIEQLPDYSNDREVIAHIEKVFLQPLDKEALRRVSSFSLQTGTAVAISPWASLDMLLSLWRSIKMIDEVAQVYGIRPSLVNRYKLLKQVINQLVFVAVSEIVIDQLMEELGSSTLTGIASARLGQGLGAGIYTARIGISAMKVSRPFAFSTENQPKTKYIIASVFARLKGL